MYQTNHIEEFLKHRGGLNDVPLTEQKVPCIIMVKDGKVVEIIEELQYTM